MLWDILHITNGAWHHSHFRSSYIDWGMAPLPFYKVGCHGTMDARTVELQASGTKQMEDHYTQSIKWMMAPLPFHTFE